MNNLEERIENLKANIALSELIGPDELTVTVSDLSALIAQLEATQKERDALREVHIGAGSNTRAAADIYFQLVEELEVPAGGSLVGVIENLKAELSAANEKLSKPVVLPRMCVGFDGVSTNAGDSVRNKAISDCAEAIRTAGFTADEGKGLWLM
ncbi:TPA: hypothetical protein ACQ39K_000462 [Yersinia enterocolitica]